MSLISTQSHVSTILFYFHAVKFECKGDVSLLTWNFPAAAAARLHRLSGVQECAVSRGRVPFSQGVALVVRVGEPARELQLLESVGTLEH